MRGIGSGPRACWWSRPVWEATGRGIGFGQGAEQALGHGRDRDHAGFPPRDAEARDAQDAGEGGLREAKLMAQAAVFGHTHHAPSIS